MKRVLFELRAKSAAFRVADTNPPVEEVTVVGRGRYKGKLLTSLRTTRITPTGEQHDKEEGAGILWLKGDGRATYRVSGTIGSTPSWRELAKGTMEFGEECTGSLADLKGLKASYVGKVDSKGASETMVWIG